MLAFVNTAKVKSAFIMGIGALASCSPNSSFVKVPDGVAYIAWLELSPDGEIVDASPLLPVEDARAYAIDSDTPVVFVGYAAAVGGRATSSKLTVAGPCEHQLAPPLWSEAVHRDPTLSLPQVTADWVTAACNDPTVSIALACAPCGIDCASTLKIASTVIDVHQNLHGVARLKDNTFILSAPPDKLLFLDIPPDSDIETHPPRITTLTTGATTSPGLAYDGRAAYIPTTMGLVIEINADGQRRDISAPRGALHVASAIGGRVFAFLPMGMPVEIVKESTIALALDDLPQGVYDLAVHADRFAVLTVQQIFVYEGLIRLPVLLPGHQLNTPAGARIAYIGDDLVFSATRQDVLRYHPEDDSWEPLRWPGEDGADARAFAYFAGGSLIGGRGLIEAGRLQLVLPHSTCDVEVPGPVNALFARTGDAHAYAVTSSGTAFPFLVEIGPR